MCFDDRLTRRTRQRTGLDKLAPIRDIWDQRVQRLPLGFNPMEDICVDEQLVGFGGHCSFKQYMPSKPSKYGIKLWALCDVSTSYAWNMKPYSGKEVHNAPPVRQLEQNVVLDFRPLWPHCHHRQLLYLLRAGGGAYEEEAGVGGHNSLKQTRATPAATGH